MTNMPPAKNVNRLSALTHLLPFCRPYRSRFLLAFIFLCVAASATLAVPFAFKNLIDLGFAQHVIGANAPGSNASINIYFLSLFGIACILAVFTAARFYMVSWLGGSGATERLLELYTAVPQITSPIQPTEIPQPRGGARVEFHDVLFHYPSRPLAPGLDRLSLSVAAGETIAIVGPSGAGKTTLFQLLLRFYDPQSGNITIDGLALPAWPLAALRATIAIVPQDTVIFSADAMENIRYGKPSASNAEVIAAAQAAQAHGFLETLPQGYQTFLGERGVRLSGGQRQRIAIARAILKDAPLLLLDEATSALDAESEQAVQRAIESAARHRTTLIVAHRLSTVRRADRVIVLDGGKVIESGSPSQLLDQGGMYARLAQLQILDQADG